MAQLHSDNQSRELIIAVHTFGSMAVYLVIISGSEGSEGGGGLGVQREGGAE